MKKFIPVFILLFNSITLPAQTDEQSLASQYMQNGEMQKAIDIYQKLYSNRRDGFYEPYFNGLMRLAQFDEAERITKEMMQAHPKNYQYTIALGRIYTEKGEQKRADELYNKILNDMPAEEKAITNAATLFSRYQNNSYAIKAYSQGRALLRNDKLFAMELGNLYRYQNNKPAMLKEYMAILQSDPKYLDEIKRNISARFDSAKNYELLKIEIQKSLKQYPDNPVYAELLAWQFLQQKQFGEAVKQTIALARKQTGLEKNIIELCQTLVANEAYDEAIQGYGYIAGLGKNNPFYIAAQTGLIKTKNLKIMANNPRAAQLATLEKEYYDLLNELGENKTTAPVMKDLAMLQAFQLKNPVKAEKTLSDLVAINDLPADLLNAGKLDLGDVYLINDQVWDATLMYSQVDKATAGRPTGLEARFRNARLAYYMGEFTWAKEQLGELIAKTSEFIDNDALNLSRMINDHTAFDTTAEALKMYARADLFLFKGMPDMAMSTLDSIDKTYPLNDLGNDISMARAKIFIQKNDYETAIATLKKIVSENPKNVWADDAVFMLGDIYQHHLNDPAEAQNWYQKIITDYPESLWINESRKRFRSLRGDVVPAL